jgi:hypothetical protein
MKKYAIFAVAVLIVGVAIGAGAVAAQEGPGNPGGTVVNCQSTEFDVDGNGLVSDADIVAWRALAIQCVNREQGGGFVDAETCRSILGDADFALADVDGDGDVDATDTSLLSIRANSCNPALVRLPRGG